MAMKAKTGGMAVNVGETVTLTARDPATGATATASLTIDAISVPDQPEPPDPGPDPEPEPIEGAARWCAPLEATISNKETGPIVTVCAWGGAGFGYSYRYKLNGAPAGVTMDEDTGTLSLTSARGSDATFGIIVTDRQNAELMAYFDFTLHVDPGIQHKAYRPEDFGGNFDNMRSRIISDQEAAGDGKHRARIELTKGKTYSYSNNHWLTGIQFYECMATGTGVAPKLKCTNSTAPATYDRGPINTGNGQNCFNAPKANMPLIADAAVGDKTLTLLNAGAGGHLKPGRWHAVLSYGQQIAGFPPNCRNIDFVKVLAVDGAQVTLDRPLNHAHHADYWEDPNAADSYGKARIGLWDGADGKTRGTQRGRLVGLEFPIQNTYDVTYIESHIELFIENCTFPFFVPSMNKNVLVSNSTLTISPTTANNSGEPDKLSEMLAFDKCTFAGICGGATGMAYLLMRDCTTHALQVSPRQFRAIGGTFDGHGDVPFGSSSEGPCLETEFEGTKFVATGAYGWMWASAPVQSLPLSGSAWQGDRLIIQRGSSCFDHWLSYLYEGAMVFTGATVDKPGAYGRVDKLYAPPDGSAMWADVTWISGTKPTSGNLNIANKGLRRLVWLPGTEITSGNWTDPSYVCMEGTPADRPFPEGIS